MYRLRKRAGLRQNELARRMGVSSNALCAAEKQKSHPTEETISKFCECLEIPVARLVLEALSVKDFAYMEPRDSVDIMDIVELAKLKMDRIKWIKTAPETPFSSSELAEQRKQLEKYSV